jgi:DNA-binding CsgD family transcriptional regulator
VTFPDEPSTSSSVPVGMRLVAFGTPAAQGMPSSRLTIIAWLPMAPTSTTTPADTMNSGVQEGSVCGARRLTRKSCHSYSCAVAAATPLGTLTEREQDVLRLMAEGRSDSAIGSVLFISESAVEKHVSSIFTKLGLLPADTDHRRVLAVLRYLES